MDSNPLFIKENEEALQSNVVQYIHEMNFPKDLVEKSVKYAVAYDKQFHMVNYAAVIKVEHCEHNQSSVLE